MKAISKRTIIALLAAFLLILSSIGATAAYFSATNDANGTVTLNLKSQTEIDEGTSDTEKQVQITNTGEASVIVRVAFFGPDKMVVTGNDNWNKVGDWYYYKKILAKGENTGTPRLIAKLEKLTDKEKAELGNTLQVTVVHESAPVVYEDGKIKVPAGWDASGVPAQ